ncbi:MAG TPA: hypothetical protein VGH49_18895 [Xanthobacteraceae bacterium]
MVGCRQAAGAPSAMRRIGTRMVAAALLGLCVAGCSTGPQAPVAGATVHGPTVAFDSIDGPPESIFRKLVQYLSDEAAARQMAVVGHDAPAQYRVRGYLAALVEKRRPTVIAWVWDVYDSDQRRAVRITGEEAATSGRGTWAAADDQLLRRIAKSGLERLAAFMAAPDAVPPPGPQESGPNIAAGDDVPLPGMRTPAAGSTAALAFSDDGR